MTREGCGPAVSGVFVTATGTGVGMTCIGTARACLFASRGLRVRARRPVESGRRRTPEGLVPQGAAAPRFADLTDALATAGRRRAEAPCR